MTLDEGLLTTYTGKKRKLMETKISPELLAQSKALREKALEVYEKIE